MVKNKQESLKKETKHKNSVIDIDDKARSGMFNHSQEDYKFTGIARSMVCVKNQGHNNIRILTLEIEDGIVKKTHFSDCYARFEAISRMELWTDLAATHMDHRWKEGATLSK